MEINKLLMEDWLADNQFVKYNLSESGFVDFNLGDFMEFCNEDISNLKNIGFDNPDTRGSLELREEIKKCYDKVKIENILVTVGVTEALFSFFNSILKPNDEVIVEYPEFQTLYELPKAIGCKIKFLNILDDKCFLLDPEKIEKMITSKTKLIIINNPHNPTGLMLEDKTIEKICKIAKKHDVYLLFDEHYKFLPLKKGSELIKSGFDICWDIHKKVATASSITKNFGLNGLRVGWLISSDEIIEKCREFKHYLTHVTPPINDYLAFIALKNKDRLIDYVKKNILPNVILLNKFMKKYNNVFRYIEPKGGLVCFPELIQENNSDNFCKKLLSIHEVSLLPGSSFGCENYFRLNFGIDNISFSKALDLIGNFIDDYYVK